MRAFLFGTVAIIVPLVISTASAQEVDYQQLLTKSGNLFKQGCSEYVSGNMTPAAWNALYGCRRSSTPWACTVLRLRKRATASQKAPTMLTWCEQ